VRYLKLGQLLLRHVGGGRLVLVLKHLHCFLNLLSNKKKLFSLRRVVLRVM
jgi:hypothetical protein